MNTLTFPGYFKCGFVLSVGIKTIRISERLGVGVGPFLNARMRCFTARSGCANVTPPGGRGDFSIAARWRLHPRCSPSSISGYYRPNDIHVIVVPIFPACGFSSHNIRPTRPIHDDSTQQLNSRSNSSPAKSTSSSSNQATDQDYHHISILQQLKKLENSLRFHGYSTIRIGVAVFTVIGLMVYLLRDPIRENVAVEVSQVASRSLEHEHVAIKAEEFAKSLLQTILHDENMHQLAAQFVKQVLNSPETRQAGMDYLSSILEDPKNRQLLASTIKQVLLLAIHDPETTAALKAVVVLILSDPESQKAARGLISAVFRHEELKAAAAVFFADVLKSQAVITQATKLGKDVTFNIISDPNLKEETGKSFWQAVMYSITPRWFAGTPTASTPTQSPSEPSLDTSEMPSTSQESLSQESLLPSSPPIPSSSSSPPSPSSSSSIQSPPVQSPSSQPSPSSSPQSQSQLPPPPSPPSSPQSLSSQPPLPPSSPPLQSSSPPLPSSSQTSVPSKVILVHSALTEEEVLPEEQILDEDSNILT